MVNRQHLLSLSSIWIILLLSCQNQVQMDCDEQINQAEFVELKVNRLDQMTGIWHLKSLTACDQAMMSSENQNETSMTDYQSFEMTFNLKLKRNQLVLDLVEVTKNEEDLMVIETLDMGMSSSDMSINTMAAPKSTIKSYTVWTLSSETVLSNTDQILISQLNIPLDDQANESKVISLKELKQRKTIDRPDVYGKVELITGTISSRLLKSATRFSLQRIQ